MPPRTDGTDGIEVLHSGGNNDDNQAQMSFKQRFTNRFKNFLASARVFIYNREKSTILGNTCSSWIKITIYYFIFYVCLGLYYCGMVAVFAAIISRQSPRYLYNSSELSADGGFRVGMGFRPMDGFDGTAISVYSDSASQNKTTSSLANYRRVFLTQDDQTYVQDCSPTEPASQLQGTSSCRFSWTDIVTSESHPCSATNGYGWPAGKPCMLIKLNKVYGWIPAPGNMIDEINKTTGQPVLEVDKRIDNIFITCNGKSATDDSFIKNNMTYYSVLHPLGISNYGVIPHYFFPYLNSPEHVQPFVLVQFTALPLNQKVEIECRAWGKDIQQLSESTTKRGITTFSLFRSNQPAPTKT